MAEDYNSWTVEELKDELAAQGKPVSGNKDELIARLNENGDAGTAATAEDELREAQNLNSDGTHKPTENELRSAVASFKASMLADGASEEDINRVLNDTAAWQPTPTYEVAVGNHGHATPYTTPSSFAIAGTPEGFEVKDDDQSDLPGGTAKEAVTS